MTSREQDTHLKFPIPPTIRTRWRTAEHMQDVEKLCLSNIAAAQIDAQIDAEIGDAVAEITRDIHAYDTRATLGRRVADAVDRIRARHAQEQA